MPRSKAIFKKRKSIFSGIRRHAITQLAESSEVGLNNDRLVDRPSPSSGPTVSESNTPKQESSSKKKLGPCMNDYKYYKSQWDPRDVNDIGLCMKITITCNDCGNDVSANNSNALHTKHKEVNVQLAYAFRCIQKQNAANTFCAFKNFPNPPSFKYYTHLLATAAKAVCKDTKSQAIEECVAENDGVRDITAIFDGTWQRRGHCSQNGVVTAIAANSGKVIDTRILTKFCWCKNRLKNEHDDNCIANYSGTSGGMEVSGVLVKSRSSQGTHNIRYKYYVGDGDSSAFSTVDAEKAYGPNFSI